MQAQFGIHLTKKDQIHRTGTEKSSKICTQQLHRPNTTNMVKSLKWENLEDRRKSARLSMLFKIQHDLNIDINRQLYRTPNDSGPEVKKNASTQERSNTDTLKDARQKIVVCLYQSMTLFVTTDMFHLS
jgi:hypothetical protein